YNSFDDDPWILKLVEYTKQAIDNQRVKILGICYGHQIIGRALGAKVGRNDAGWEIAVCDVDLTEQGKKLFGKDKLGHPEFKQDIVSEIVKLRMSMGAFSKEQGEDALARAGKDHDGIAIGVAFLKFLLGDIQ
ncbi:hypothetical protein ACP6JD_008861, partial [Aspergillus fumigatus]